jgi:hypothetical protein
LRRDTPRAVEGKLTLNHLEYIDQNPRNGEVLNWKGGGADDVI